VSLSLCLAADEKKMEKKVNFMCTLSIILCKKTLIQTKAKLDKYYGHIAPSISLLKKWFTEF
jgi:hypothetical protein